MQVVIRLPELKRKKVVLLGLLSGLVLLPAIYYVASIYFFLGTFQTALRTADATSLDSLVDFPAVRQSLKDQLSAAFGRFMAKDPSLKDNPWAGVGTLLGPAIIDRMVDSYCTPEMVAMAIKKGGSETGGAENGFPQMNLPDLSRVDWSKLHFQISSLDSFRVGPPEATLVAQWRGLGWRIIKVEISQTYLESKINNSNVTSVPTASPSPEQEQPAAVNPDREDLASDEDSDLSNCSYGDLTIVAQLAAKYYLKSHPHVYSNSDRDLAIRLGMRHHLLGDSLFHYWYEWLDIIKALSASDSDATNGRNTEASPTASPSVEPLTSAPSPAPRTDSTQEIKATPSASADAMESDTDSDSLGEHTQEVVKTFAENFIMSGESNDPSERNEFYAPVVEKFYEHRNFTKQQIAESDREYAKRWPTRHYQPKPETFRVSDLGKDFSVTGLFSWSVSSGSRTLTGISEIRLRIDDTMHIVEVNEQNQKSTGNETGNPLLNSKEDSDSRFFAGAHLGMTIEECRAYYKQFTNVGAMEHSGAAPGQVEVDFRNDTNPQRRVYLAFRKRDGKVLLVIYWKLGEEETFSSTEEQALLRLNAGNGRLVTKYVWKNEFLVTTPKEYQVQDGKW
jgi:hypothetical protein